MTKVITYGTYDMLHYGHIRLLERAKKLGDYLVVGVTSDDFDKTRGKINVQQSLSERVAAVRATGLADEIIVEEYEGQKIADIKAYGIDIFAIGSDWIGKFDYLNAYCKVVYLERTQGVSSTELRTKDRKIKIALVGESEERIFNKYYNECQFVNGADVVAICTNNENISSELSEKVKKIYRDYDEILDVCDAVYIVSHPSKHYEQIEKALLAGKHVLCESPIALSKDDTKKLFDLAKSQNVILMDAIKTAYATAYDRMLLLIKSGKIGNVISVDATCTSIQKIEMNSNLKSGIWNSICSWGPTALLPVLQILGVNSKKIDIASAFLEKNEYYFDSFSKINLLYDNAVASVKVGRGVKSEGELIISGTKGYIYVPAPWWKTDYFEIRYENPADNKRYFYQLDGEGIRYELVAFLKAINDGKTKSYISREVSEKISEIIGQFYNKDIDVLG